MKLLVKRVQRERNVQLSRDAEIHAQRIDAVGVRVRVADLIGLLFVVADAADPVDSSGFAGELELLVEALVVLDVCCVEVRRDQVRAVLVLAVDGVELAPRGAGAEVRRAERVVDEQVHLVELARLFIANRRRCRPAALRGSR